MYFDQLLRPFKRFLENKVLIILYLAVLLVYIVFTKAPISIIRASLMLFLRLLAVKQMNLLVNTLYLFIVIAIFLLLIKPLLISSLSFQLSFLATFGILYLLPRLEERINIGKNCLKKYLFSSILLSFSAQFFLWPIFIINFSEMNFSSFISNILILPLMDLLLAQIFLFSALLLLSQFLANFLFIQSLTTFAGYLIHNTIDIIIYCINILLNLPFISIFKINNIYSITFIFFTAYLFTFIFFYWQKIKHLKKYKYRIIC